MKFSDIIGHERVKQHLRKMVDTDRIPHALLLEGPEGIGKLAMARVFAQYIHCMNRTPDGEPCGKCPSCLQHQAFNHADIFFVFPVYKKNSGKNPYCDDFFKEWKDFLSENLYVSADAWIKALNPGTAQPIIYNNEGNAILQKVSMEPYSSRYKIMVLWQPEKMNTECANRLLKIIEEPYDNILMVFVSNEPNLILPTIYSRIQRVAMKGISAEKIARYLADKYAIDEQTAASIANVANGSVTNAESLLGTHENNELFLEYFKRLMRSAYKKDLRDLKDWSEEVADFKREKSKLFLEYTAKLIRENFIYNLGNKALSYMTPGEEAFSAKFCPFINERNISGIMAEIDRAVEDVSRNANAKIVLFDFAIKMIIFLKM